MGHLRQTAIQVLRNAGILSFADGIRCALLSRKNRRNRARFLSKHPTVKLPPDEMIFETFGKLDYQSYYHESREAARELIDLMGKHHALDNARICEWGCGPARLLRHMTDLLIEQDVDLTGTDYNVPMIDWAATNIPGVTFLPNRLSPPLPVRDQAFDIVYSISVMTHLSEPLQREWLKECLRVLAPGGIFLFTVIGDSYLGNLLPGEQREYRERGILVRGRVGEGRKNFGAYNSPDYVRNVLLKGMDIAEHIVREGQQDIWMVRKG